MSHPNPKPEAALIPAEPSTQTELPPDVNEEPVVQARAVRYMDDDTFRRSLEEVVSVHDRLLAKLAE